MSLYSFLLNFNEVKIAKVIILLLLVLKTSGVFSISMPCCDDKNENLEILTDLPVDNNESEDKGCCGDGICECLCCSHIFTFQKVELLSISQLQVNLKSTLPYIQNFSDQYGEALWQPPRQV